MNDYSFMLTGDSDACQGMSATQETIDQFRKCVCRTCVKNNPGSFSGFPPMGISGKFSKSGTCKYQKKYLTP